MLLPHTPLHFAVPLWLSCPAGAIPSVHCSCSISGRGQHGDGRLPGALPAVLACDPPLVRNKPTGVQDDESRWYGELLHLCTRVVTAMHENECKVRDRRSTMTIRSDRATSVLPVLPSTCVLHRDPDFPQGIADNFDPEVTDTRALGRLVLETLERCELHLRTASSNHPLVERMAQQNGRACRTAGC